MNQETTYNTLQFEKFSSAKAFVEINEAFGIDKIRLGFRQYDNSQEKGNKMRVSIDYYLTPRAALEFADAIRDKVIVRKTENGTKMLSQIEANKQLWVEQGSPDNGIFYSTAPGGTDKDGKTIYRIVKVLPARSGAYRLAAYQAPGKRDEKGLIQMAGDCTGYVFIPLSESDLSLFGEALRRAVSTYDQFRFYNWMKNGGADASHK